MNASWLVLSFMDENGMSGFLPRFLLLTVRGNCTGFQDLYLKQYVTADNITL